MLIKITYTFHKNVNLSYFVIVLKNPKINPKLKHVSYENIFM